MGIDIREVKNNLRRECKDFRRKIPFRDKAEWDEKIYQSVVNLPEYQNADLVLTYVSTPIEVATFRLIAAAWAAGKTVAVPRCVEGEVAMEFFQIRSMSDLESGTFSVLEPNPARCKKLSAFPDSICVIPGLSFDKEGYRLGYGKGYYDRFLNQYRGFRIGICYEACIKSRLPHGRFDVPVHVLITESTVQKIPHKLNPSHMKPFHRYSYTKKKKSPL